MSVGLQIELTDAELEIVKESLRHSKRAREDYAGYPNPDFKSQQIEAINALLRKLGRARSRDDA